jgi:hypothetical protein
MTWAWTTACGGSTLQAAPAAPQGEPTSARAAQAVATEQTAPTPAQEAEATAEEATVAAPVDREVVPQEGGSCTLEMASGVLSAACTDTERPVRCVVLARGDLADPPGEEVVWRCGDGVGEDEARGSALVMTHGDTLLWNLPTPAGICDFPPRTEARVVDALADAQGELLVHQTGCETPGEFWDEDSIWKWRSGRMERLVRVSMSCSYTGDTSDAEAEEPAPDEAYVCQGGYLEVRGPGAVNEIETYDEDGVALCSGDRDAQGRVVTGHEAARPLRWDAATHRFTRLRSEP